MRCTKTLFKLVSVAMRYRLSGVKVTEWQWNWTGGPPGGTPDRSPECWYKVANSPRLPSFRTGMLTVLPLDQFAAASIAPVLSRLRWHGITPLVEARLISVSFPVRASIE